MTTFGWDDVIAELRSSIDRAHASVEAGDWDVGSWAWRPVRPTADPTPEQTEVLRLLAGELELALATVEDAIAAASEELDSGDRRRSAVRSYVANAGRG